MYIGTHWLCSPRSVSPSGIELGVSMREEHVEYSLVFFWLMGPNAVFAFFAHSHRTLEGIRHVCRSHVGERTNMRGILVFDMLVDRWYVNGLTWIDAL